jgi:hypothetical protein
LRNRIYSGDFEFDGITYQGTYEPIVSRELWERVQIIFDGRASKKRHGVRVRDRFAFRGLISCGHCGCALVGEIKKGRYVYYHCTGYKGKCPEPYTREEVLENKFTELLKGISFSEEVLAWVTQALRMSHGDEKKFHDEAITRLRREHRRIQDRIDAMYMDKLDGRIDNEFFDRQATAWRTEQMHILRNIETHVAANQSYVEEGIKLMALARRAHELFENQPANEKRKLLDFVLSNSIWKNGELLAEYRQPFDVLAIAVASDQHRKSTEPPCAVENENWLPRCDSNHD